MADAVLGLVDLTLQVSMLEKGFYLSLYMKLWSCTLEIPLSCSISHGMRHMQRPLSLSPVHK